MKWNATIKVCAVVLGAFAAASPASAQFTRVTELPASAMFSVRAKGDTIVAGSDTSVFVSTNAGTSWKLSTRPSPDAKSIVAVRMLNRRLYAGTFGKGVFVSDDLGSTWHAFNEGLVGGFLDSQLDVSDLEVRGDSLYAATEGAGVYVRRLSPPRTWSPFGNAFEPNQAANVNAVTLGGTRLLASAGSNGSVLIRDPADPDWAVSDLANTRPLAGVQAEAAAFTGSGWVVGCSIGVFHSVLGQAPWTQSSLDIGPLLNSSFANLGPCLFGAFDITNAAVIERSCDDGATWSQLDFQPNAFVFALAVSGGELYVASADGLFRRSTATLSVPGDGARAGLRFAVLGAQPVRDQVRFGFQLSEPGSTALEVFDILGRRAGRPVEQSWSAGAHEMAWDARGLAPGVYQARLAARGEQEVVRLVRVR